MEISVCPNINYHNHYTFDNFTYCDIRECDINAEILINLSTLCNVYDLNKIVFSCGGVSYITNTKAKIDIYYHDQTYEIGYLNAHYTATNKRLNFENIYAVYKYLDDNFPNLRQEIIIQKIATSN